MVEFRPQGVHVLKSNTIMKMFKFVGVFFYIRLVMYVYSSLITFISCYTFLFILLNTS